MQIIFSGGKPPWQVKEEYRKINRSKEDIIIVGMGSETSEVQFMYPDFLKYVYDGKNSLFYPKAINNDQTFKIGCLELKYIREDTNSAWRNCRSVELSLGKWFIEKFGNNVLEVGDVTCHYSFFKEHLIVDTFGPYEKSIRKSAELVDYANLNVLSISTLEHLNNTEYENNDPDLGIKVLQKIHKETKNYLITIPIGGWRPLEDFLMNQNEIKYTFLQRNSYRFETNNWTHKNDRNLFYENYLHFEYNLDYYGCAGVIVVITNQPEILQDVGIQ